MLVTGPTGSGKSTTLYAALNAINSIDKNIITIEDPVEYQLPGVNQIQVNLKAGLTFARGLRSMLRADPDVIMVGEIRDAETARIAVESALTGHLVLSTLHTNDAPSAITRLTEMGIEPFLTASALDCVVAQRLVRTLCTHCKRRTLLSVDALAASGITVPFDVEAYEPVGCGRCAERLQGQGRHLRGDDPQRRDPLDGDPARIGRRDHEDRGGAGDAPAARRRLRQGPARRHFDLGGRARDLSGSCSGSGANRR